MTNQMIKNDSDFNPDTYSKRSNIHTHSVQPGDVLIVDRGFRDASEMLEDLGLKAETPKFLPKGQHFSVNNRKC